VLNEWYGMADAVTLTETDGRTVWRQLVAPGGGAAGPGAGAMAESLEGYSLRYQLRAPADIRDVNLGTTSGDGRTAELTIGLADIVTMTQPLFWEVQW
jgi:hypothetical protein